MVEIPLPNNRVSLHALRALLQQRNILAALEVFHAELGDVFQIPLPGFNPVMLAGPEANRLVLVDQRGDLRWRAEQDPITRLLRHGVLVEEGDSHDSLRRQINPALHRRALEHYVEAMWQCTDSVINDWHAAATPLDMLVETRKIALLVLTKTLFSVDFEPELRRLWQAILRTLRYISPGMWVVWRDVPRAGYQRALKQMDDYLYQIIRLRRESKSPDNDVLGLLIASGMPDALIRDQLLTMIIAGHDTSTALLSWALYVLSSRPDIQSQVQQEVDAVLGSSPPDHARIGELHYLDQVMNETLRLYPPIHLGSRIAASDMEFQGFRIPAGRRVLYSIYLTHRDARYWHNPTAFDPERFSAEQVRQRPPYTFLPFGGGPRNCIGMAFAQVEAKVVLARVLQKFDLVFTGHPVRLHMGATLEPHPGVRVKVRRRS
jgi:cytochrome P450